MYKTKEILTIVFVFAFFIGAGVLTYFYGVKSHETHYIRLEVNPKIEILTDSSNIVTSVFAVNEEAETLIINEKFIGIDITEACEKFFDLCTRAGYIDIDGKDNTVRITIVAGFMQALEMQVYESINNYLIKNEIYTIIVENDSDRTEVTDAKDENVSSPNKLALIKSIMDQDPKKHDFKKLNSLTESKLINIIKKLHNKNDFDPNNPTTKMQEQKENLIKKHAQKINEHKEKITDATTREFHKSFDKYKRENKNHYELDFDKIYDENFPHQAKSDDYYN